MNLKNKKQHSRGCRHSSVDSSALSVLSPQVLVPSTPSTLFQFILFKLYICHLNWNMKRTKINKKRPGLAHLLKWCVGTIPLRAINRYLMLLSTGRGFLACHITLKLNKKLPRSFTNKFSEVD